MITDAVYDQGIGGCFKTLVVALPSPLVVRRRVRHTQGLKQRAYRYGRAWRFEIRA